MMRRGFSAILDIALLVSCSLAVFTFLGGEVRWTGSYFRFRSTNFYKPLLLGIAILAVKASCGLNAGVFALLCRRGTSPLARGAGAVHRLELKLRSFYLNHRVSLVLSLTVFLALLVFLEVFLRHFPDRLPQALANHVATGYTSMRSGIYRYNAAMKSLLMRPNYEREMYFNGYRWHHRTDSMGFRNPTDRSPAHVVLLGDSMIYGHGVEETSTVRHHLEEAIGKPVGNLGMQGASIHQEYQVLKNFGIRLQPKYVFLFFLHNDITDLPEVLTDVEMRRFLALPISDHATPYLDMRPASDRPPRISYFDDLYVVKAYEVLRKGLGSLRIRSAGAFGGDWQSLEPFRENPRLALAMRFHLHALLKFQDLADRHRFRFMNVFIFTEGFSEQSTYEGVLQTFCRGHGIDFLSLREEFEAAMRRGEQLFLKGDGHFSDGGSRLAAKLIAQHIRD